MNSRKESAIQIRLTVLYFYFTNHFHGELLLRWLLPLILRSNWCKITVWMAVHPKANKGVIHSLDTTVSSVTNVLNECRLHFNCLLSNLNNPEQEGRF